MYGYLHYLHLLFMAYLYRKDRSPFWYVVYSDANKREVHRSTGLRADNPNDTAEAKALRASWKQKNTIARPSSIAKAGIPGFQNIWSGTVKPGGRWSVTPVTGNG